MLNNGYKLLLLTTFLTQQIIVSELFFVNLKKTTTRPRHFQNDECKEVQGNPVIQTCSLTASWIKLASVVSTSFLAYWPLIMSILILCISPNKAFKVSKKAWMWWTSKCENIKFEPVVFSAAETVFLCLCVFRYFKWRRRCVNYSRRRKLTRESWKRKWSVSQVY